MELTNIGRNIQTSFQQHNTSISSSHSGSIREEDEVELQWAAIERLPTFKRLRTSLFDSNRGNGSRTELGERRMIDVTKLGPLKRHLFIDKLRKHIENDNLQLLQRMRERIDRVGVNLPTVEVRYKNLSVEARCKVVQGKPLPTLWNSLLSMITVFTKVFRLKHQEAKINILNDVSGIIKPSR
ncbi:pleiotropic drug resistance protein 3-like [Cornus florida]|uniref:pleiotropic drug resistance protein 3-like n=1 Tax=Cornus florida TaxID=4283 RepID=UPI0028A05C7B|nr:pleiotropic drug resistance protein 3-like [Cornus florida]